MRRNPGYVLFTVLCLIGIAVPLFAGTVECISVAPDGTQSNSWCTASSVSSDGRYVAFSSSSSNIIPGKSNGHWQLYVRDRLARTTECISLAQDGAPANSDSGKPVMSSDARFVAFGSNATNLVPGTSNGYAQIYVRDRQTGTMECVSLAPAGTPADCDCNSHSMSADGRYVAFVTESTNLVPGTSNGCLQVYVRDRQAGTTECVSVSPEGLPGYNDGEITGSGSPAISADGRYVAFHSCSTNLVNGVTTLCFQVYVRDRQTGTTECVSTTSDRTPGESDSFYPSISADGRYVAFESGSATFVTGVSGWQAYVKDRQTGEVECVSLAPDGTAVLDDHASDIAISGDGRFVTFNSWSPTIVHGNTTHSFEVCVRDRQAGITECISLAADGTPGDSNSYCSCISPDGRYITFTSDAGNLISGISGDQVYLRDRGSVAVRITSPTSARSFTTAEGSIDITGNASSTSSLSAVGWSSDRGESGVCTGGATWSAGGILLQSGWNKITITASDTDGNIGIAAVSVFYSTETKSVLLTGLAANGSVWYTSDLQKWTQIPGVLSSVKVGEMNGDGKYEVTGLANGSIWQSSDKSTWGQLPGHLNGMILADLNGDGKDDIAGISSGGSVWYSTDETHWSQGNGRLQILYAGDFSGSGKDGIAGIAGDSTIWYSNDMSKWMQIPGRLEQLAIGDFDGDGKDDIAGLASDMSIWYSCDKASWKRIYGNLLQIVAGDFNGDGIDDLAGLAGDKSIWYTTDLQLWKKIPGHLSSLVTEDLNNDGKADLAGVADDGTIWYTTDLSTWHNIPGRLASLEARRRK